MLMSNRHNFIYMHIPKAAGQSVTNALMPYAALPYQRTLSKVVPFRTQLKINTRIKRHLNLALMPQPYNDHVRLDVLLDDMGKKNFEQFFSFTFIRNPWDRLLSTYSYTIGNPRHRRHTLLKQFDTFEEYVSWHCDVDKPILQKKFVYDRNGVQRVNFVGRFERLEQDFNKVCEKIGIAASLPIFNASKSKDYRVTFSDKSRALVEEAYAPDIEAFGYSF